MSDQHLSLFKLRQAGIQEVILNDRPAIMCMFTVHLDDENQTMLTYEVDGVQIPIIVLSMPVMSSSVVVPDKPKLQLLH